MALQINKFRIDRTMEVEGVWCDWMGCKLRVARIGNPAYQTALVRAQAQNLARRRHIKRPEDIDDALASEGASVQREMLARHILKGWEGIEEEVLVDRQIQRVAVPYSVDKALELLGECPELEEAVYGFANNLELFKQERLQEERKN